MTRDTTKNTHLITKVVAACRLVPWSTTVLHDIETEQQYGRLLESVLVSEAKGLSVRREGEKHAKEKEMRGATQLYSSDICEIIQKCVFY